MEGVLVSMSFFIVIFGIVYLYFSTRHKERMALIDKGIDASIFFTPKTPSTTPVWKILILNLSLISMGVGLGIIIGSILEKFTVMGDAAYPASVFLISGLGLLIGFFLTKNIDK